MHYKITPSDEDVLELEIKSILERFNDFQNAVAPYHSQEMKNHLKLVYFVGARSVIQLMRELSTCKLTEEQNSIIFEKVVSEVDQILKRGDTDA